mgnify:CR=1 FL=1
MLTSKEYLKRMPQAMNLSPPAIPPMNKKVKREGKGGGGEAGGVGGYR